MIWGNCVIILNILCEKVVIEFYFGYIGIVKMKVVVRFYVWWFKFDEVIEEICKVCFGCRSV